MKIFEGLFFHNVKEISQFYLNKLFLEFSIIYFFPQIFIHLAV